MLPIRPYFRNCFIASGWDVNVLNIELMTASSDHHVFMRITTCSRLGGSEIAQGNGYLLSHRLTRPASRAAGIFSGNRMLRMCNAFFSPGGLVFGRMGEFVVDVSSLCSSRRLRRQLIRAVNVVRSPSRLQIEVRDTIIY